MVERICARCGEANPGDAQFCIDCGAALTHASTGPTTRLTGTVCPVCYAHNPEGVRFCAGCGRSFTAQPQVQAPAPTPRPQPPRPQLQPRQSYPRTATPPQLQPYRPAAPPYRPGSARQNPGPIVFLIGLAILLMNGAIWPGILVLIGLSILFSQLAQGNFDKAVKGVVGFGLLAVLFGTGHFWPGGFIMLMIFSMVFGGRGGSRRRFW